MSIRSTIHSITTGITNTLSVMSIGVGVYSIGSSLKTCTWFNINNTMQHSTTELSSAIGRILAKPFYTNNIPGTNCTLKAFLEGGEGYKDGEFKPNWNNFNEFISNTQCYPALMIVEKVVSNAVFGFHTNLTLTLPLFKIIDDGISNNDANMLLIGGSIAAVDVLHALTMPSAEDLYVEHLEIH